MPNATHAEGSEKQKKQEARSSRGLLAVVPGGRGAPTIGCVALATFVQASESQMIQPPESLT